MAKHFGDLRRKPSGHLMFLTIFGAYNCFWRFLPLGHSNSLSVWEMLNSPKTFYLIPTK